MFKFLKKIKQRTDFLKFRQAGKPNVYVPKCFYSLSCYVFSIFSQSKVTGSEVGIRRGEIFVTEKDLNATFYKETTRIVGEKILLRDQYVKEI